MQDQLERAIRDAAEFGAPAKTWLVPETAEVEFGTGRNPFANSTFVWWQDN
jgi:hypothetical protein